MIKYPQGNLTQMKTLVMAGMFIGSVAGGYLPILWGGSIMSMSSVFLSGAGGLAGIWAGYKLAKRVDI